MKNTQTPYRALNFFYGAGKIRKWFCVNFQLCFFIAKLSVITASFTRHLAFGSMKFSFGKTEVT